MMQRAVDSGTVNNDFWDNRIAGLFAGSHLSGSVTISPDGSSTVLDPHARDVEAPAGSALFEHLLRNAGRGGFIYLTRDGRRVAAVVPADVAESLEQDDQATSQDHDERMANLQELLDDAEARLGAVPQEVQDEVEQQLRALATRQ